VTIENILKVKKQGCEESVLQRGENKWKELRPGCLEHEGPQEDQCHQSTGWERGRVYTKRSSVGKKTCVHKKEQKPDYPEISLVSLEAFEDVGEL
jgi:hypothetical protein